MKKLLLLFGILIPVSLFPQRNVVEASRSSLTGIILPSGTRQDKRILSTASAKYLMDEKLKETGKTGNGAIEVFYLPSSSGGEIWKTIVKNLELEGYKILPLQGDNNYITASSGGKEYLLYYGEDNREISLYISGVNVKETSPIPDTVTEVRPVMADTKSSVSNNNYQNIPPANEAPLPGAGKSYHFTTTNFDDGWVATVQSDYVVVTKGGITVLLFYPEEITDRMRPPENDISDYFWNSVVVPRYSIVSAFKYEAPLSYFSTYYIYGEAKDKSTGRSCYLGMNAVVNSGIASVVLASAESRQSFDAAFPHPDSLKKMLGYNRFAISYEDLPGKWSASSGAAAHYYNVYTGAYAGMQFAQGSDEFYFNADGTYSSKHAGAMGNVGNTTFYNQEYKGKAIAGNWDLSLTNRWKGEQDDFHAWFECVKGGRILNLVNKKYSGIKYSLVKIE